MDDGLGELERGVVDEVAGREVVGAVDHDVVAREDLEHVRARQPRAMLVDLDVGVEPRERLLGAIDLRLAEAIGAVKDLALQVRRVDDIVIDDADRADARRGGYMLDSEPTAGADAQHLRRQQLELSGADSGSGVCRGSVS